MRRNNIIKPRRYNSSIKDTRGDRKRKFSVPTSHHLQSITPNASSQQREPLPNPRSDDAKTSEFAYFKKLKKEAAQSELFPKDQDKCQFTNVESNHYEREKTMKLKQIYDEPKASVPIGTERTGDHRCLTPPVRASNSSETSDNDMIFPLLNEKVTPINRNHWTSFSQSYPNDTGVQHCDKGIFALKRRKLRQCLSGTLHQENDELCSEGFSLVPMLLSRLFPEDNKENCDWERKYSKAESSAQDQLHLFPDDNTHSRRHYETHKNDIMESKDAAYEDYYSMQCFSEHCRDVVLPELKIVCADSPSTTYSIKTYSPCRDMKPYHKIAASFTENLFPESNSARYQLPLFPHENTHSSDVIPLELDNADADFPSTTYPIKTYFPCTYVKSNPNIDTSFTEILFPESNSCFQLQSEKYGSIAWADHLKNFDKCYDPNGSLLQGQPQALLLGWDYSNDKDEQGLSISSYNRNMNLLAHSGNKDHWQSHDRQNEGALSSSSLVSSYFLNCHSLMQPSSANFCSAHDSGRYFKYENYLYAKLDHFPVPFSCNPDSLKYFHGPSEDFSMDNQLETRNAVFSTQDHFWNLNKVICGNNFDDQESLFFSTSLDRELGKKHLTISDYSTENQLTMVHAYQNPQHVGPGACFFGEGDKEFFSYKPRCTSDYCDGLNIQRSGDNGVSIQRHSTSWGFPILERYHTEAGVDPECEFEEYHLHTYRTESNCYKDLG